MNRTELESFAGSFLGLVDKQDAEMLRPYLSEDVLLRMANFPATIGVESLIESFKGAEERFTSVTHFIQGIWTGQWENGTVVSVEAVARYTFADKNAIEVPVTSTLRLNNQNRIADYRIFMDPGPAFS